MKPDNIYFTSVLPNYINIATTTGPMFLSGTIPNGGAQQFISTIAVSTNNTRCDVYGTSALGVKQLLSSSGYVSDDATPGGGIYRSVSTELVQLAINQYPGSIWVTFYVNNNTGADITLINQAINISVVEYQIPF